MPRSEADHFVDELLETSAIVFGIKDRRSPGLSFLIGEPKEIALYIATETGANTWLRRPRHTQPGCKEFCSSFIFVTSWNSNQKPWMANVISSV
jgi:hypothetical protein